jgi:hypothetical protein
MFIVFAPLFLSLLKAHHCAHSPDSRSFVLQQCIARCGSILCSNPLHEETRRLLSYATAMSSFGLSAVHVAVLHADSELLQQLMKTPCDFSAVIRKVDFVSVLEESLRRPSINQLESDFTCIFKVILKKSEKNFLNWLPFSFTPIQLAYTLYALLIDVDNLESSWWRGWRLCATKEALKGIIKQLNIVSVDEAHPNRGRDLVVFLAGLPAMDSFLEQQIELLLLEHPTLVNTRDPLTQHTPLFIATGPHVETCVRLLLNHRADITSTCVMHASYGKSTLALHWTPAMMAMHLKHTSCLPLLEDQSNQVLSDCPWVHLMRRVVLPRGFLCCKNIVFLRRVSKTMSRMLNFPSSWPGLGSLSVLHANNVTDVKDLLTQPIACNSLWLSFGKKQGNMDHITDQQLHLASLLTIETFSLDKCIRVSNAGLNFLANVTSLRNLDLSRCHVDDAGVRALCDLQLTDLNLTFCSKLTNRSLVSIASIASLRCLSLHGCHNLSDEGFNLLSALTSLKALNLGCTSVSDKGLQFLGSLSQLEALDLSSCQSVSAPKSFSGMCSLQNLKLLSCRALSNECFALLTCSPLRVMAVSGSPGLSDRAMEHIGKITTLRQLEVEDCDHIFDPGVAHLRTLVDLQSLSLKNLNLSDAALRALAGLTTCDTDLTTKFVFYYCSSSFTSF